MTWCESCQDHYEINHYTEDGEAHRTGAAYGSTGVLFQQRSVLEDAQVLVAEQADDPGLWFNPVTTPEAYLQLELRRLHHVIEHDSL